MCCFGVLYGSPQFEEFRRPFHEVDFPRRSKMTWKRARVRREKEEQQQARREEKKTLHKKTNNKQFRLDTSMRARNVCDNFSLSFFSFDSFFASLSLSFGSRIPRQSVYGCIYYVQFFFMNKRRKKTVFSLLSLVDSRNNQTLHGNVPKLVKIDGVNDVVWFIAIGRSFIAASSCHSPTLSRACALSFSRVTFYVQMCKYEWIQTPSNSVFNVHMQSTRQQRAT